MPIVGDRPDVIFKKYDAHIGQVIRDVLPLPAGFWVAVRPGDNDRASLLLLQGRDPAAMPLETNVGRLYLSLRQDLSADPEGRAFQHYRLRVQSYSYRLGVSDDALAPAQLRFEYDKSIAMRRECRHHLHVDAAVRFGEADVGINGWHLPTGYVLIEHVIQFLFHDLGVTPKSDEWPNLLRQSILRFHRQFTDHPRVDV
jgi:hypothetical protein